MATANQQIFDGYVRHQTYVLRYASGLRNELVDVLADTEGALRDRLLALLLQAPGRVLGGRAGRAWSARFRREILKIRNEAWQNISTNAQQQLIRFAQGEAQRAAVLLQGAVPVVLGLNLPPASQLVAIVNSQPYQGATLRQWVRRAAASDVQRIYTAALTGITQGRTPTDITRSIVGTRRGRTRNAVARRAFRDLESVLRTVTNGMQQQAKQALYQANSDVIQKEVYTSTLDARTTLICSSNDGRVFKIGEGPIPPLHFQCRSLRVPFFDDSVLGNRPFNPTTERMLLREYANQNGIDVPSGRDGLPRGHKGAFDAYARGRRRELIGQAPRRTTYNAWLRQQTAEFQNEVLGERRAAIFRRGGITLDRFVARDGSTLSLSDLEQRGITVT